MLDHYSISLPESLLQGREQESETILKMIHQHLNAPLSCGAGRVFDAVAALLDCCQISHFQAEAPIRLEHLASDNYTLYYDFDQEKPLDNLSLFEGIVSDLSKGKSRPLIAAKFHNTFVKKLVCQTLISLHNNGLSKKVILSGGCFQNRRLSQSIEQELNKLNIQVFTPRLFPVNDSGISLGQLAIAATIRNKSYA
jgi:Hydrogenase maturation factor